jgi:hypothetical protein
MRIRPTMLVRDTLFAALRGLAAAGARCAAVLLLVATMPALGQAQATPVGRLTGRIVDAASGQPVVGAGIQVVGTTPALGAMSGVDGRYVILNVPAGTTTLTVRFIGYTQKSVTGILVPAGGTLEQDISMVAASLQLAAIEVTSTKEKGTVNDALNQQKNATNVVNAITAEQIARSPDSDAAQATQRVSGVTVQDGKFVQARGMSERFTTASLNGSEPGARAQGGTTRPVSGEPAAGRDAQQDLYARPARRLRRGQREHPHTRVSGSAAGELFGQCRRQQPRVWQDAAVRHARWW